jgi:hypothetical protein
MVAFMSRLTWRLTQPGATQFLACQWLLPTPLGPSNTTFSARSMKRKLPSSCVTVLACKPVRTLQGHCGVAALALHPFWLERDPSTNSKVALSHCRQALQQFVERDRIVAHPHTGGVVDRVRHSRRDTADAKLSDAFRFHRG